MNKECSIQGKVCFRTKAEAEKVALSHGKEFQVYHCGFCNAWHITTHLREEQKKKQQTTKQTQPSTKHTTTSPFDVLWQLHQS